MNIFDFTTTGVNKKIGSKMCDNSEQNNRFVIARALVFVCTQLN